MSIRVVLAEDDYLVREGVARLIATEDDLELVATCADYTSLLESVDAAHPAFW
jgi:DNA-binding NarL/FixJ family response regulator